MKMEEGSLEITKMRPLLKSGHFIVLIPEMAHGCHLLGICQEMFVA